MRPDKLSNKSTNTMVTDHKVEHINPSNLRSLHWVALKFINFGDILYYPQTTHYICGVF